jgi:hypothetical protein
MSDTVPVRVMLLDAWDEYRFEVPGSTTLSDLKRKALDAGRVRRDPRGYALKFRGAELRDESRSVVEAGIVPNGALIVLPRRRQPVR